MNGTSLKYSSFGNDKAHKICISRTNTIRAYSWNLTDEPFTYQQVKEHLFPKGDDNYNEIEFSLASIEVWNNKNTHNLSQWRSRIWLCKLRYIHTVNVPLQRLTNVFQSEVGKSVIYQLFILNSYF